MADEIERVIDEHFYKTPEDPSAYEAALLHEALWDWYRRGERVAEVIASVAELDAMPSGDIREFLYERHYDWERMEMGDEGPFDEGAHYAEKWVTATTFTSNGTILKKA